MSVKNIIHGIVCVMFWFASFIRELLCSLNYPKQSKIDRFVKQTNKQNLLFGHIKHPKKNVITPTVS